jgi:hypothetical protein
VKLVCAELALVSVTAGPAVWVQAYVRGLPSGSLAEPLSCTKVSSTTVTLGPAVAVGARFAGVPELPSPPPPQAAAIAASNSTGQCL